MGIRIKSYSFNFQVSLLPSSLFGTFYYAVQYVSFAPCRATDVALQVVIVCCAYYHLRAQQIFVLQKVDAVSTFCNMKFVALGGGNTRNKQSQLGTQHLLCDKLQQNIARITWPLRLIRKNHWTVHYSVLVVLFNF